MVHNCEVTSHPGLCQFGYEANCETWHTTWHDLLLWIYTNRSSIEWIKMNRSCAVLATEDVAIIMGVYQSKKTWLLHVAASFQIPLFVCPYRSPCLWTCLRSLTWYIYMYKITWTLKSMRNVWPYKCTLSTNCNPVTSFQPMKCEIWFWNHFFKTSCFRTTFVKQHL